MDKAKLLMISTGCTIVAAHYFLQTFCDPADYNLFLKPVLQFLSDMIVYQIFVAFIIVIIICVLTIIIDILQGQSITQRHQRNQNNIQNHKKPDDYEEKWKKIISKDNNSIIFEKKHYINISKIAILYKDEDNTCYFTIFSHKSILEPIFWKIRPKHTEIKCNILPNEHNPECIYINLFDHNIDDIKTFIILSLPQVDVSTKKISDELIKELEKIYDKMHLSKMATATLLYSKHHQVTPELPEQTNSHEVKCNGNYLGQLVRFSI